MAQPRLRSATGFTATSTSDDGISTGSAIGARELGATGGSTTAVLQRSKSRTTASTTSATDGPLFFDVAREQRVFANDVDRPRDTSGVLVNRQHRIPRKQVRRYSTHAVDSGSNVRRRLIQLERFECAAKSDALFQLPQARFVQTFRQLRLSRRE